MLRAVREPDNWPSGLVAVRREGAGRPRDREGNGGQGVKRKPALQASYWAAR